MGSPLAPILANLFMGHHEKLWLENFQGSEMLFYRRYVDDTFCFFHSEHDAIIFFNYRNFRPITRTADYPQRSIFVVRGKKVQQITRTPKQKKIMLLYYRKLGAMTIPCCCLQSERLITYSAKNWLLTMQP